MKWTRFLARFDDLKDLIFFKTTIWYVQVLQLPITSYEVAERLYYFISMATNKRIKA